ncbi:MAG: AAA family ATPase [Candidatus Nanopelagicales bacterium]
MRVEIGLLGGFVVTVDGVRVPDDAWRRRSSAALVKLLAITPALRLHREQVLDALWSEVSLDVAAPRLHKAAHFARRAIGLEDGVDLSRDVVTLLPGHEVVLDTRRFEELAQADPDAAIDAYHGRLLPTDIYEPWTQLERDRLHQQYLHVLRERGHWRRLVSEDPADESAHMGLLTSLADAGDVRGALAAYDRMVRDLDRELGLVPSPAAQRLRADLLARQQPLPMQRTPGQRPERRPERQRLALLEREEALGCLDEAFDAARHGLGSVVVVSGQPGVGKTSLLQTFVRRVGGRGRLLIGGCDDLLTPRPLGPLVDVLDQQNQPGRLDLVLPTLIAVLADGPAVLIVEDAHWADDATIDALRILSRRVPRMPAMLVLSYREEDLHLEHPLRAMLGAIARDVVTRIQLSPLSEAATTRLAEGSGVDVGELYRLTQGNPLFVHEVLESARGQLDSEHLSVPPSVRDAVLGRVAGLGLPVRTTLGRLSMVPSRCERWLAEKLANDVHDLTEAERRGLLRGDATHVWFHHELSRHAVADAIPSRERLEINQTILDLLTQQDDVDPARVVHHAEQAGDVDRLRTYSLLAARSAASAGAHREADAQYERVLRHVESYSTAEQPLIHEEAAVEAYRSGRGQRARSQTRRALVLHEQAGDLAAVGRMRRWLSRIEWFLGDRAAAEREATQAVELLRRLPASIDLAWAYAYRSQLAMLAWDRDVTEIWAQQALTLARQLEAHAVEAHALVDLGTIALLTSGDDRGMLSQAYALAEARGEHQAAVRALQNHAVMLARVEFDLPRARRLAERGVAYADEHEVRPEGDFVAVDIAEIDLLEGRWDGLDDRVVGLVAATQGVARLHALITLARLRVRSGHPDAAAVLKEAWERSVGVSELLRAWPLADITAEHAWLSGTLTLESPGLLEAYAATLAVRPAVAGQLARWVDAAGGLNSDRPAGFLEPHQFEVEHRWREAAVAWRRRGLPYEAARAAGHDPMLLGEAVAQAEALGAVPLAHRLAAVPV